MSLSKKYSGLPDLDASQEIYETPALTDDASTVQTDTLRTDSPTPSDEHGDERLVRERIDQNTARRRFEPTLVSARDVNFSDTIVASERKSYRTKSRRRRRRDYADSGSESEDETLTEKIARLKREAEEVRLELEQKGNDFQDSVEQQDEADKKKQQPEKDETREMDELHALIAGLDAPEGLRPGTNTEESLLRSLAASSSATTNGSKTANSRPGQAQPSTNATLAAIADRMTALETALGLPSVSTSSQSILPTLDHLSTQLNTLTTTLTPTNRPTTTSQSSTANPNLDDLQTRIRALTIETDKLTASRKNALASLAELHEARLRYNQARHITRDRPQSGATANNTAGGGGSLEKQEATIHSDLFLSEQASKITALYQVLPSITDLQPLLPVVLDRLRSLSVIHAGAAEARGELDEVVRRQGESRAEVKRWREAVEETERKIGELKGDMSENVKVVGGMVKGVEERVKAVAKE